MCLFCPQAISGASLFLGNAPLYLCKVNKKKIVLPFMSETCYPAPEKGGNETHRIFQSCESFESFFSSSTLAFTRSVQISTVVQRKSKGQCSEWRARLCFARCLRADTDFPMNSNSMAHCLGVFSQTANKSSVYGIGALSEKKKKKKRTSVEWSPLSNGSLINLNCWRLQALVM